MMTALKQETQRPVNSHFINDDMEIVGIFKAFHQKKEKLWVWQQKDEDKIRRIVHYAMIRKVDALRKTIEFCPNNTLGFHFDPNKAIYLYSNKRSIALKLKMREYSNQFIIIGLPKKLNLVEGHFLNNIELVERENEQAHEHKRQVPRIPAKSQQTIGLRRTPNDRPGALEVYPLHDISRGGMSFVVNDPAEFVVGERLELQNIDNRVLPKKLPGKVVSIKLFQEAEDEFKIGVAFGP